MYFEREGGGTTDDNVSKDDDGEDDTLCWVLFDPRGGEAVEEEIGLSAAKREEEKHASPLSLPARILVQWGGIIIHKEKFNKPVDLRNSVFSRLK